MLAGELCIYVDNACLFDPKRDIIESKKHWIINKTEGCWTTLFGMTWNCKNDDIHICELNLVEQIEKFFRH